MALRPIAIEGHPIEIEKEHEKREVKIWKFAMKSRHNEQTVAFIH
jgi:hypothetical protein